jgi:hypothetical protein
MTAIVRPPMPAAVPNPKGTAGAPDAALTLTAALSEYAATGTFWHSAALETTSGLASAVRVSSNERSTATT